MSHDHWRPRLPRGGTEAQDVSSHAQVADRILVEEIPTVATGKGLERQSQELAVGRDSNLRRPASAGPRGRSKASRSAAARPAVRRRSLGPARVPQATNGAIAAGLCRAGELPAGVDHQAVDFLSGSKVEEANVVWCRRRARRRPRSGRPCRDRRARPRRAPSLLAGRRRPPRSPRRSDDLKARFRNGAGKCPLELVDATDERAGRTRSPLRPLAAASDVRASCVRKRPSSRRGSARCGWCPERMASRRVAIASVVSPLRRSTASAARQRRPHHRHRPRATSGAVQAGPRAPVIAQDERRAESPKAFGLRPRYRSPPPLRAAAPRGLLRLRLRELARALRARGQAPNAPTASSFAATRSPARAARSLRPGHPAHDEPGRVEPARRLAEPHRRRCTAAGGERPGQECLGGLVRPDLEIQGREALPGAVHDRRRVRREQVVQELCRLAQNRLGVAPPTPDAVHITEDQQGSGVAGVAPPKPCSCAARETRSNRSARCTSPRRRS